MEDHLYYYIEQCEFYIEEVENSGVEFDVKRKAVNEYKYIINRILKEYEKYIFDPENYIIPDNFRKLLIPLPELVIELSTYKKRKIVFCLFSLFP